MSFINYSSKEINCKIVYCGPSLSGKTTSIKYIYETSAPDMRGRLISIEDKESSSLFFDFLPINLGAVNNFKTRFHLYSVPGKVAYEFSSRLLLKGVDGIVFVADSQKERLEANIKALDNLSLVLNDNGYDIKNTPMVFQYNKRDLSTKISLSEISKALNVKSVPEFETIATEGKGVYDSLKGISKLVLEELRSGLK